MDRTEIEHKVAAFPRWHYQFDLNGVTTPIWNPSRVNRHVQRRKYFFDPLTELCGGSLAGARVLDLGCNAGFWSLNAIEAGCDYVLGVDGRQMHVDQANLVFEAKDVEKSRYDFLTANLFDIDLTEFGNFDVVLCLGLLYHVSKHMNLFEIISKVSNDLLVIDTSVSLAPGSYLKLRSEAIDSPRDSVDYELVMTPTKKAVADMAAIFGYETVALKPDFSDYTGARDYLYGRRRAFICSKGTSLDNLQGRAEPIREGLEAGTPLLLLRHSAWRASLKFKGRFSKRTASPE